MSRGPHQPWPRTGLATSGQAELVPARRQIRELETELAVYRRATELLKERADRNEGL